MENLIKKIKEKKELNGLPDELVKFLVEEYLLKNKAKYSNSEKNQKIVIKEIRSQLRVFTGQYTSKHNLKNREKLLTKGNFSEILNEHKSTKERVNDYVLVNKIVNKINPKVILDLGCGLNPLAIASKETEYHAYDINAEDLKIVKKFFEINNISGKINHKDITKEENFPKADLCIIFKVLDILGKDRIKITKQLLEKIDSKFFLISFATNTLSGKPMSTPYRKWFENIIKSLNYKCEVKRTQTELFYLVKKSQK